MEAVHRNIFIAIFQNKWLNIEYKNKQGDITKYWIGIKKVDPIRKRMVVDGLHLRLLTVMELNVFIDSIVSSSVVEGTYYHSDDALKKDITDFPSKYAELFNNVENTQVLSYYNNCYRLDCTPYKDDYSLLKYFDGDKLRGGSYELNDEQFRAIVKEFSYTYNTKKPVIRFKDLALNILSIPVGDGQLYVLAYKPLILDAKEKKLVVYEDIMLCHEFTINGNTISINHFLDADDLELLKNFKENINQIKDRISANRYIVDDRPYLLAIGRDYKINMLAQYEGIENMLANNESTDAINAFFGHYSKLKRSNRSYNMGLLNKKVNLDQLLAIHNAMKSPIAYIQGPPGTGKTNTIINTLSTAYLNNETVLFVSNNNHPIDEVFKKMTTIKNRKGETIPFPIVRIGSYEKVAEAFDYIKYLYESVKDIEVKKDILSKGKSKRNSNTKQLGKFLEKHEQRINLLERKETIEALIENTTDFNFTLTLQSTQLEAINKELNNMEEISIDDALNIIKQDDNAFKQDLYYSSILNIQKLAEPKYASLRNIIYGEPSNIETRIKNFNSYLSDDDNLREFLKIFPIVVTTAHSAYRLGSPKPHFDMVIMDEASQCNAAVALVPIIRGQRMMLVGDPQQLNPVIVINELDNAKLKDTYQVDDKYDYAKNSIYKTFLACDSISNETLLSQHYRCDKKIIGFNNKKYYRNMLKICSESNPNQSLVHIDVKNSSTNYKNTSPLEAEAIVDFLQKTNSKNVGIITPFVNQKKLLEAVLKRNHINNVECGTVHAFQGDEKDIIIFSLALTDKTSLGTYNWLRNNRELINVAVSRARKQLIVLSDDKQLTNLHKIAEEADNNADDIYELVQYVKSNGETQVTERENNSRALGIKPYTTETEEEFLITLNHALDNTLSTPTHPIIKEKVDVNEVFENETDKVFTNETFDFVVYSTDILSQKQHPIFAVELGEEKKNDILELQLKQQKKKQLCANNNIQLLHVNNTYIRRYQYIKDILERYFKTM